MSRAFLTIPVELYCNDGDDHEFLVSAWCEESESGAGWDIEEPHIGAPDCQLASSLADYDMLPGGWQTAIENAFLEHLETYEWPVNDLDPPSQEHIDDLDIPF